MLGPQGDGSQGFEGSSQGMDGGWPSYSGRQKQMGLPSTRRQPELGPQGFGEHSSPSGTDISKKILNNYKYIYIFLYNK